jgi:eukaryotic-like serine/threonine-protein kinase
VNESRYRLVRPLATGGMAELFLGVARGVEGFEKPVAIKRILPHLASEPAIAQMFLAEARLATHLQHQNIASIYDVGRGPDGLFLVMELVNGWDLGVLLRHAVRVGQRFPPHLVAFIGSQALAGLIHAYRRTHGGRPVLTAHRDISPSNILISREGEVKVADFGIARLAGVSMGTQPGTFKGKLPYASPETLRGAPATAASDQFALGIVLHELLAGKHPFDSNGEDPMAIALAITQQEPPPLTDIPASLAMVVRRALVKAPEGRFLRPEDMAEVLARYLAQTGEPATSQSLAEFIASLNPPPTLVEKSEADEQSAALDSRTQTVRRPSLATRAVEPSSFELQPVEDWVEQPGGAALSMSGRLVLPTAAAPAPVVRDFRCSRCNAPLPSAHAPCDRCAQELSPGLSTPAEDVPLELDAQEVSPEPQAQPRTPPRPTAAPQAPLRSVLDMQEEELQLVERAPRPRSDFVDPNAHQPRRRLGPVVVAVAAVLLVVGGGVVAWPHLSRQLDNLRSSASPTRQVGMLSIQSEPSGATVSVDGAVLGTTPLMMDNTYPVGDIPVKVTMKGYKPWTGTFSGGQPQSLDVKLRR